MSAINHLTCPKCQNDCLRERGSFTHETGTKRIDGTGTRHRYESWSRVECTDCGHTFATRDRFVSRVFDENGEELPEMRSVHG